jgi:hypothetical protein
MRIVLPVVFVALIASAFHDMQQNIGGFETTFRPDYLIDGEQLNRLGLARGDQAAVVGDAFEAYSAFVAGTPIIAQVIDSSGFWQLSVGARSALQGKLAAAGAKAILANNVEPGMRAEGWQIFSRADSSNLGVLILRP